jgi:DNA polymerase-3 subunit alpha
VITAEATMESDQLKLLMRSAGPVDAAIADAGRSSLRIYLDDVAAISTVATVLEDAKSAARNASPGSVYLYLQAPGLPGDVEMDLGQPFPINPQIKGAIKSLEGVMEVEEI